MRLWSMRGCRIRERGCGRWGEWMDGWNVCLWEGETGHVEAVIWLDSRA
jgi:hypothetical protein